METSTCGAPFHLHRVEVSTTNDVSMNLLLSTLHRDIIHQIIVGI